MGENDVSPWGSTPAASVAAPATPVSRKRDASPRADTAAPRAEADAPEKRDASPGANTSAPGAEAAATEKRNASPGADTSAPGAEADAPAKRDASPGAEAASPAAGDSAFPAQNRASTTMEGRNDMPADARFHPPPHTAPGAKVLWGEALSCQRGAELFRTVAPRQGGTAGRRERSTLNGSAPRMLPSLSVERSPPSPAPCPLHPRPASATVPA